MNAKMKPSIGMAMLSAEGGTVKAQWDGQPARPPKNGEYYISGAIPAAYRALNDLSTPYFIASVRSPALPADVRTLSATGDIRTDVPPQELMGQIAEIAGRPFADATPLEIARRADAIMKLAADLVVTAVAVEALKPVDAKATKAASSGSSGM